MKDWGYDKRCSDRYVPEVKSILGCYLIGEAPVVEDQKRNTDLMVLNMWPKRIACRLRREDRDVGQTPFADDTHLQL